MGVDSVDVYHKVKVLNVNQYVLKILDIGYPQVTAEYHIR